MLRFLRSLLLAVALLSTPGINAPAHAVLKYLVKPNLQPIVYVSSVSYNGIGIGSDISGDGSAGNPLLTCTQAINSAGANATIIFNGNPAAPTTYICPATVNKAVAFSGRDAAQSARITGVDTNKVFSVNPTGGQLVAFQWLIIDPSLGSGGAAARCIDLESVATTYNVTIFRVTFQNWTTNCINTPSASFKGNVSIDNVTMTGGTVQRSISISTAIAGQFTVNASNITVTDANAPGAGAAIYIRSTAAGPTVNITNTNTTTTFANGLASNQYFNVEVVDTPNTVIDGGTHTCTVTGVAQCWVVGVQRVSASLGITGSAIRNTTCVITSAASGACIYNSTDSAYVDTSIAQNLIIEDNSVDDVNQVVHGIFMTTSLNSFNRRNTIVRGNLCNVDKNNTGLTVDSNTIGNCSATYMLNKGSTNSVYTTNLINMTNAGTGGGYVCSLNDLTGILCTGATLTSNIFDYNGGVNGGFASVAVGGSTTFTTNTYTYTSGTLPSTKWAYGASNYTTCANWQAAQGAADTCVGIP